MLDITANAELVAYCGLYCGACKAYQDEKCKGCHENAKATWCKVRTCCTQKRISTCAECAEFPNPKVCKNFNNFMSRVFGLVFRSDRAACIVQIKQLGLEGHAKAMAEAGCQTIKR